MKVPTFLKRLWGALSIASTLAWLLSIGVGTIASSAFADVVHLRQPWRSFFFIGVLFAVTSILVPLTHAGFALLSAHLPGRPTPESMTFRQASPLAQVERQRRDEAEQEDQRRRANRAAIHEAITTLEHHKAEIEHYTRSQSPTYQGDWPQNRAALAEEPRYDRAVRATERAFQAVPYYVGDAALAPVVEAISELEEALRQDHHLSPNAA